MLIAYAKVAADESAAIALAERRGHRAPSAGPAAPPRPGRSRVATGPGAVRGPARLGGRPGGLYEADLDVSRDEPGEVGMDEISRDEWRAAYGDRPDLDRSLTSVALMGDVAVAFSFALTDGRDRYQSGMVGPGARTAAWASRGRSSRAALRRARRAGYRHAVTSNNADNEAVLAVNRRLGHRVVGGERQYRRK